MVRMIRKQVYIEPHQEALLKRCAKEMGVSEAELIRQGIEEIARKQLRERAWKEALDFMQERAKIRVPQTGRAWKREELYEERLERLSRRH